MKQFLKIVYNILIAFIVVIALLLVISAFPIPGNYKVLVVQSGSMTPEIKMGSVVVIKPHSTLSTGSGQEGSRQAADYKIGDIITFGPYSKTKAPTTHRIYEIKIQEGEQVYFTKGDANNAPDSREIRKEDILGKVLFSVPYLGYAVDFAKKPLGFLLLIIIPAAIIIFDEIKKIAGEIKKKNSPAIGQ